VIILGLTGSIGMGKSTVAGMLEALGVPVYDSDAAVHRLIGQGGRAVARVEAAFPGSVKDGAVDRAALGKQVFNNTEALKRLEAILHPMVSAERNRFLKACAAQRLRMVALDVPLLFETGGHRRCDATIVVTAADFVQAGRVLRRPGMTAERLADIRARQMPEAEKRRRGDFVLATGAGHRLTMQRLTGIVRRLSERRGHRWPPR
jgi:dephospho-CoA kinase